MKAKIPRIKVSIPEMIKKAIDEKIKQAKPPDQCDKCPNRAIYFDKEGGAFCKEHEKV